MIAAPTQRQLALDLELLIIEFESLWRDLGMVGHWRDAARRLETQRKDAVEGPLEPHWRTA